MSLRGAVQYEKRLKLWRESKGSREKRKKKRTGASRTTREKRKCELFNRGGRNEKNMEIKEKLSAILSFRLSPRVGRCLKTQNRKRAYNKKTSTGRSERRKKERKKIKKPSRVS